MTILTLHDSISTNLCKMKLKNKNPEVQNDNLKKVIDFFYYTLGSRYPNMHNE